MIHGNHKAKLRHSESYINNKLLGLYKKKKPCRKISEVCSYEKKKKKSSHVERFPPEITGTSSAS